MNELVSLTDAKAALYEALRPFSPNGCFLRFSDMPEELLACDLPRRGGDLAGAEEALARLGWRLLPEKRPGLWLIDRALCRLLLLHPAPLAVQPMELNRALWLWTVRSGEIKSFHETCAALLRQGKPLPTLGGQLLNVYLQNQKGA